MRLRATDPRHDVPSDIGGSARSVTFIGSGHHVRRDCIPPSLASTQTTGSRVRLSVARGTKLRGVFGARSTRPRVCAGQGLAISASDSVAADTPIG